MTPKAFSCAAASILSSILLSGCSGLKVHYQAPLAPQIQGAANWNAPLGNRAQSTPTDDAELSQWWSIFGDPELTSLEQRALKANLDLLKAEAEIRQARANRDYNAANMYPSLTGSFSSGETKYVSSPTGGQSSLGPSSAQIAGTQYTAELQGSWEPDFFGAIRKNVASYSATAQSQVENLRNVMVTLTAEVALDYIDVRLYQAQLAVTKSNLAADMDTYRMTLEKRRSGLASDLDVQQALESAKSTESTIPTLETNLKESCNGIAVLLGERPGAVEAELAEVKPIPVIPSSVAVGIPGDLIRRRPDIRQAERQYAAQWYQVGVAKANLYPTFTLSGSFSASSQAISSLFSPASLVSSVTGSVQQALINRKALRAQVRVQSALLDQYEISYQSTVLGAIQDVENAIQEFSAEQIRRRSIAEDATAAQNAAEMSRELYAGGLKDFLTVLDSERTQLSAQNSLVQSDATVAGNLVRLYRAMGGGWR